MADQTPDTPLPPNSGSSAPAPAATRGAARAAPKCSSAPIPSKACSPPGELLKIALAACSGMSSDFPLSRRLGDDYDATIKVSGAADRENEVYPHLEEELILDLSELDADAQQRLLTLVERSVDKVCTVGRTLKTGTKVSLTITSDA